MMKILRVVLIRKVLVKQPRIVKQVAAVVAMNKAQAKQLIYIQLTLILKCQAAITVRSLLLREIFECCNKTYSNFIRVVKLTSRTHTHTHIHKQQFILFTCANIATITTNMS